MAASHRPFRFAVQSFAADSGKEWRDTARRAEALGFSALHVADHYIGPGTALASTNHPVQSIAAIPAIAVAAEATTTLRVGSRVMCIDYHQPVVLAKELATIDLFSEGRLEAGLGAGWLAAEYDAMGVAMDPPGERIERLSETVDVMRACFSGAPVDVQGRHVRAHDFEALPRPVQQPGPPIMIGGGSPRVLRLAGAKADIVSLNFDNSSGKIGRESVGSSTAELTDAKIGWIREGAGDRFGDLELEIAAYFTFVTDDAETMLGQFGGMFGLPPDEMARHPHTLIGTVDAICDELVRRREAYGISYVTVGATSMDAFAPVVERLAGT